MFNFLVLSVSFFLLIPFALSLSNTEGSVCNEFPRTETKTLNFSENDFIQTAKNTVDLVRVVIPSVYGFLGLFVPPNSPIYDCLELLDSSVDSLKLVISAAMNSSSNYSPRDLDFDLKTWLSAALVDQNTCIDGVDGLSEVVFFKQIMQNLEQLLTEVVRMSSNNSQSNNGCPFPWSRIPWWVNDEDDKSLRAGRVKVDAVVAADGSGNFTRIVDALSAAPNESMSRFVIHIKQGVYNEYVEVKKDKWNIMMVGDGMNATVITGNRSVQDGYTTFRSATFAVRGRGFLGRDITFENTAGPGKHQAVAYRSDSDLSVCLRCEFRGYQDTLYTHTMRQFYKECVVRGTVDFIFGDAIVMFQNCTILARRGLPAQKNTVTAQGRMVEYQPTGFSFQFCNVSADIDLLPYVNNTRSYLGRPWKNYSRTVFMQSHISNAISPEGWLEWNQDLYLRSLYYGEYLNYGPGATPEQRVHWSGYHQLNLSDAGKFTAAQFIDGDFWLPFTGVNYTSELDVW